MGAGLARIGWALYHGGLAAVAAGEGLCRYGQLVFRAADVVGLPPCSVCGKTPDNAGATVYPQCRPLCRMRATARPVRACLHCGAGTRLEHAGGLAYRGPCRRCGRALEWTAPADYLNP